MQLITVASQKNTETTTKQGPSVSLIMPFNPKMTGSSKPAARMKQVATLARKKLTESYPASVAQFLIKKLMALLGELDYSTHKTSVALVVSSEIEKIYYLNGEVQEALIVEEAFKVKNILTQKQFHQKYLLLTIGEKSANIFVADANQCTLLVKNSSAHLEGNEDDEVNRKNFMHYIDDGLSIILNAYPLPLLLCCTEGMYGTFKLLSRNAEEVSRYIPGNYVEAAAGELENLMKSHLEQWQEIRESYLLQQIRRAASLKKCSVGIREVYHASCRKTGKLLIIEKEFVVPLLIENKPLLIAKAEGLLSDSIYINDVINEVIEQVLSSGGDVEFVSAGVLEEYMHIVLIAY